MTCHHQIDTIISNVFFVPSIGAVSEVLGVQTTTRLPKRKNYSLPTHLPLIFQLARNAPPLCRPNLMTWRPLCFTFQEQMLRSAPQPSIFLKCCFSLLIFLFYLSFCSIPQLHYNSKTLKTDSPNASRGSSLPRTLSKESKLYFMKDNGPTNPSNAVQSKTNSLLPPPPPPIPSGIDLYL